MKLPPFAQTSKAEVITLSKNKQQSQGLDGVLRSESAQRYFSSLPTYVQEMIMQRRESVRSEDDLRAYAENLTKGDC